MAQLCLCILGWYFPAEFYKRIVSVPGADVFIVSHRDRFQISSEIFDLIPHDQILFFENIGYDWGGYQQFLSTDIYKPFDYVVFSHDDIDILDLDVYRKSVEIIKRHGNKIILGNGRQTTKRDWVRTHIQSYAHSTWKPPSWDFLHDTVRGSFWATSRQVLDLITPLEVFWDRHHWVGSGAGNWSLRATCGKAQERLGENGFQFLGETYLASDYILEKVRGELNYTHQTPIMSWRIMNYVLVHLSRWIMFMFMNTSSPRNKRLLARYMERIFGIL